MNTENKGIKTLNPQEIVFLLSKMKNRKNLS